MWTIRLLACLLGLWTAVAWAAPLTTAQLQVLKADILASPDLADEVAAGLYGDIAKAYNLPAVPDYWAWKTNLKEYDIYSLPSPTGSQWDWAQFKGLTTPEQTTWSKMFQGSGGTTNYSLVNIRAGVAALFAGAPPAVAQKAHIDAHGRRLVTRGERLYVTPAPPAGGAPATPGTMAWEGQITITDVSNALALP